MSYNLNPITSNSGIYQIVNSITQKRYIGYASNIRTRWNGHLHDLLQNKHPNQILQRSWNKHGRYNFLISILQLCEKEMLCLYEDYWVKVLKTEDREFGYNIRPTDPNGKPGNSKESIEKPRLANIGRKRTLPKGRKMHPHTYQILNKYWKTHKRTKEHEEARMRGIKKVDWKKLRKDKCKKVFDWEKGIIYNSAIEAIEASKIPRSTFLHKLQGSRKNDTNYTYI